MNTWTVILHQVENGEAGHKSLKPTIWDQVRDRVWFWWWRFTRDIDTIRRLGVGFWFKFYFRDAVLKELVYLFLVYRMSVTAVLLLALVASLALLLSFLPHPYEVLPEGFEGMITTLDALTAGVIFSWVYEVLPNDSRVKRGIREKVGFTIFICGMGLMLKLPPSSPWFYLVLSMCLAALRVAFHGSVVEIRRGKEEETDAPDKATTPPVG